MKFHNSAFRITTGALLLAVGWVLPLLIGSVQVFMQGLSPMHIPALAGGFLLGPWWGMLLGFALPLSRSLLFGMPVLMPTAVCMAFELAAYGLCAGLMDRITRRAIASRPAAILAAMIPAMIAGRLVGGAARAVIAGAQGGGYTFQAFLAAYFTGTAVGAVLHLIVVPALVLAAERVSKP